MTGNATVVIENIRNTHAPNASKVRKTFIRRSQMKINATAMNLAWREPALLFGRKTAITRDIMTVNIHA